MQGLTSSIWPLAPTVRIRGATDAAITLGVVTAKAASTLNTAAPYNRDHILQYTAITKVLFHGEKMGRWDSLLDIVTGGGKTVIIARLLKCCSRIPWVSWSS